MCASGANSSDLATGPAFPPVWDSHVHCYPEEVIRDPSGWAEAKEEAHWKNLVTDGPQGWADPVGLVEAMDRDGIQKVLLQAWYWEKPETAFLQNEWHRDWVARYPDRLLPCAAVHPDMKDIEDVLDEARAWGAVAVGECLPQIQVESGWRHPGWGRILDWTTRNNWPVILHLTESVGHDYPGRIATPLMEILEIFESHPEQTWICAHWGGGLPFYSLNRRVGKALRKVWFDTAASPLLYDARIWQVVRQVVGAERILFGSDFPLVSYPRKQREPGWNLLLEELRSSGLPEKDLEAVSWKNLSGLLPDSSTSPLTFPGT